ncbi:MAG: hypothetical protein DLM59_17335 [Pseudonocardiales bacterium]|nr:MAG: hypothetical protein DLM59_17335 [Pseudonocardiales bacterium]
MHLQRLAAALGDAMSPDDVARVTLASALEMDDVVRAGLAVSQGADRELEFVASDADAVSPAGVRWCQIDGLADVPLAEAARTGSGVFLPSLAALEKHYPHLLERQRGLGTRSLAALPLAVDERRLGAVLLSFGTEHDFDISEQAFFGAYAAQVTQALRRGLAYRLEHSTSERLQRSLLPRSLPDVSGLALGAHYQPGGLGVDVGGDWYDVLELADGSVLVALGDVMGKGVPAAIVMGHVRSAMRAYALLDPSPELVLERLDSMVASLAVPEQIVTMVYGVLDPRRRYLTLSVAGHPLPLYVPTWGPPAELDVTVGPPLGLGVGPWPSARVDLSDDATVLFYSDGLVESREIPFAEGLERLSKHIAQMEPRRRNPRELCARLGELMWQQGAGDDVTMLALTSTVRRRLRNATADLPSDTSATPRARRFVGSRLTEWGVADDVVEVARLCVSELVTNAVIHSGTAPRVTVRLDDERLLVLVQDRGRHGAARRAEGHDPMDISGRGLLLVDALATTWSAEHSADGTTVWFELDVIG